jgi:excisionase family DNA binding protein
MHQPSVTHLDQPLAAADPDLPFEPPVRLQAIEPLAVDATQAAALIGVSRGMFFKLVDAGRIGPAGVRLGRCVRYPLPELRAWVEAGMPPRHEWANSRK